jgi:membrane protein
MRVRLGAPRRAAELLVAAFREHDLLSYASAIAFRVLVSLIPIALLGIALLGAFGHEEIWDNELRPPIEQRVTVPTFAAIDSAVQKIFQQGTTWLIVFAGLLSIWDVSSAVRASGKALNRVFDLKEERPAWHFFGISFAIGVVTLVCLAGAAIVIPVGARLASDHGGVVEIVFGIARWPVAAALIGLAIGVVVRFAPAEQRQPEGWITAGTALIVLAWMVASLAFRWFAGSIANYKSAAGNLTVFLILTSYVYASAVIFLVGVQVDELLRQSAKKR